MAQTNTWLTLMGRDFPEPHTNDFLAYKDEYIARRKAPCITKRATTKYIDYASGSDASGTPTDPTTPWKTFEKVAEDIQTNNASDVAYLFKCGVTHIVVGGQCNVDQANIYIGSYGPRPTSGIVRPVLSFWTGTIASGATWTNSGNRYAINISAAATNLTSATRAGRVRLTDSPYFPFRSVTDAATCSTTDWSYYCHTDGTIYVNLAGVAAATDFDWQFMPHHSSLGNGTGCFDLRDGCAGFWCNGILFDGFDCTAYAARNNSGIRAAYANDTVAYISDCIQIYGGRHSFSGEFGEAGGTGGYLVVENCGSGLLSGCYGATDFNAYTTGGYSELVFKGCYVFSGNCPNEIANSGAAILSGGQAISHGAYGGHAYEATFTRSGNNLNCSGHGLTTNDIVYVLTSGTLPTGLTNGTAYYVTVVDANNFTVSTSQGGSTVTLSSAGSGTHKWYRPFAVYINDGCTITDPRNVYPMQTAHLDNFGVNDNFFKDYDSTTPWNPNRAYIINYRPTRAQQLSSVTTPHQSFSPGFTIINSHIYQRGLPTGTYSPPRLFNAGGGYFINCIFECEIDGTLAVGGAAVAAELFPLNSAAEPAKKLLNCWISLRGWASTNANDKLSINHDNGNDLIRFGNCLLTAWDHVHDARAIQIVNSKTNNGDATLNGAASYRYLAIAGCLAADSGSYRGFNGATGFINLGTSDSSYLVLPALCDGFLSDALTSSPSSGYLRDIWREPFSIPRDSQLARAGSRNPFADKSDIGRAPQYDFWGRPRPSTPAIGPFDVSETLSSSSGGSSSGGGGLTRPVAQ